MPAHAIGRTPRNPLHPSMQRGEARSGRETSNRRGLDHVSLRSSAWRIVQKIGRRGPITAERKLLFWMFLAPLHRLPCSRAFPACPTPMKRKSTSSGRCDGKAWLGSGGVTMPGKMPSRAPRTKTFPGIMRLDPRRSQAGPRKNSGAGASPPEDPVGETALYRQRTPAQRAGRSA